MLFDPLLLKASLSKYTVQDWPKPAFKQPKTGIFLKES